MKIKAIKEIAMRKMLSSMSSTSRDLSPMLDDNVSSFYTGIPLVYNRTGALANSAKVTGVKGGGNSCSVRMELDPDAMSHHTGTFSEEKIIDATNNGTSGVVGTPGYWGRAEENARMIADSHFRNNFG